MVNIPAHSSGNDICLYYLRGNCTRPQCEYKHNETYARFYRQAVENFNRKDREPLTVVTRYLQIAKLYTNRRS
jgi:excinuclease UvrABC nuclease subunit